jgi:hypothetical protein
LCQRYYFQTEGVIYATGYGTNPSAAAIAQVIFTPPMRDAPSQVTLNTASNGSSFAAQAQSPSSVYFTALTTGASAPRAKIQANAEL